MVSIRLLYVSLCGRSLLPNGVCWHSRCCASREAALWAVQTIGVATLVFIIVFFISANPNCVCLIQSTPSCPIRQNTYSNRVAPLDELEQPMSLAWPSWDKCRELRQRRPFRTFLSRVCRRCSAAIADRLPWMGIWGDRTLSEGRVGGCREDDSLQLKTNKSLYKINYNYI